MAKAFQNMLEQFGLTDRVLGINADNASANDKKTTKLSSLNNSFKEEYQACCFNHTLPNLLKLFNVALSGNVADNVDITDEDDEELPNLVDADEEGEEEDNNNKENEDEDDEDDGVDELETLSI